MPAKKQGKRTILMLPFRRDMLWPLVWMRFVDITAWTNLANETLRRVVTIRPRSIWNINLSHLSMHAAHLPACPSVCDCLSVHPSVQPCPQSSSTHPFSVCPSVHSPIHQSAIKCSRHIVKTITRAAFVCKLLFLLMPETIRNITPFFKLRVHWSLVRLTWAWLSKIHTAHCPFQTS